MRDETYFYEINIDGKIYYFYSKTDINNCDDKSIVLREYFTDTKAFYRSIGTEWHNEINNDGSKINYYTNINGLFFPKERLIYASRSISKNYVKTYFDKNQPSITRQFSIKNVSKENFYHSIKYKLKFSKTNKCLFNLYMNEQIKNKKRDIKKDKLNEEKDRLYALKIEQERQENLRNYILLKKKSTK